MAREAQHITDKDRLALLSRRAAHAPAEPNLLTRRPALERPQPEHLLLGVGGLGIGELVLADVEAGPVDGGGGAGEGGVGVPQQGGDVGEVAGSVSDL